MICPLLFALPGNEVMTALLRGELNAEEGRLETRQFPDGESYVRFSTNPEGRHVVLVCSLDRPDGKFLRLAFAADAARELGASSVGLIAPYLCYLRQDTRFKPGEAVTSLTFAQMLSERIDWLVTTDPHLHRYASLDEIYRAPAVSVHSAALVSQWIRDNVDRPLLIGPDVESEQWVAKVAEATDAPYRVFSKRRHGDRDVVIELSELRPGGRDRTPVLVDDIVSSARTMTETARLLVARGFPKPVAVAVHGLFAEGAWEELASHTAQVVTTNSVPHPTNDIDISGVLAAAVHEFCPVREDRSQAAANE